MYGDGQTTPCFNLTFLCSLPRFLESRIAKISMTSSININASTRALLAGETKASFVRWLANLKIDVDVCKQISFL